VTELETTRVVDFWKEQARPARPEYDQTFLLAPPEEAEEADSEEFDGTEDPMYQDAVRVVLELGKASTSTLQRRLRLGYGRGADSRHDAAGGHHRPARWKQAARGIEAARLAPGGREPIPLVNRLTKILVDVRTSRKTDTRMLVGAGVVLQ